MKSPIEILRHKHRLERLLLASQTKMFPPSNEAEQAEQNDLRIFCEDLKTKITTLEWVLSEKP